MLVPLCSTSIISSSFHFGFRSPKNRFIILGIAVSLFAAVSTTGVTFWPSTSVAVAAASMVEKSRKETANKIAEPTIRKLINEDQLKLVSDSKIVLDVRHEPK